MEYYILSGVTHEVKCPQCKYYGYESEEIQHYVELRKACPKGCRYYRRLIRELQNSGTKPKVPEEMIVLDDIWYFLDVDYILTKYICLVYADQVHATSDGKIWHGYTTDIIQKWKLDMNFMYYLMDKLGIEAVLEKIHLLVDIAIDRKDWKWYQWLLSTYPDHVAKCEIDAYRRLSIKAEHAFCQVASALHKAKMLIWMLISRDERSNTILDLLLQIDYSGCSQAEINGMACEMMSYVRADFLRQIYVAGLHFDHSCVICDANEFYEKVYMKSDNDCYDLNLKVLDAEFIDFFQELDFPPGCFQVCYLQACLNCDMATIKKLQPQMNSDVVTLAIRLTISMFNLSNWHQHHNRYRSFPETEKERILVYLLKQLMPDRAWILANLQDLAEKASMGDFLVYKFLPIDWPPHVNQILAKWNRIHDIWLAIERRQELSPDIDVQEYIDYIQTWYKTRDLAKKILQFSLQARVPFDTRVTLTSIEMARFSHFLEREISWTEYLIFVANVKVKEVLDLAAKQNAILPGAEIFSQKFQIQFWKTEKADICRLHEECFYYEIMDTDLVQIYQDLVAHDLITAAVIESVDFWRKNRARKIRYRL